MEARSGRAPIDWHNLDQNVLYVGLGILDEYVKITVFVEHSGIQQLELRLIFTTPAVFFHQSGIRKFGLWILVEIFHVGVRGRTIDIKVVLFHILAMIAFVSR